MTDDKKDFRKFLTVFIIFFCGIVAGVILLVVTADPFYQYHSPWFGMPVIMENAVYQTPGAARNLEYTDVITGTSMTENFHTGWFDQEMGWKTMKLSYSGARTDDMKAILEEIFSREEPVRHIFMDINDYQLTSPGWTAYAPRPEYLYGSSVWDDLPYVLNRDVAASAWRRVLDGLEGVEDNIDTAYTWEDPELFGAAGTLEQAREVKMQIMGRQDSGESQEERLQNMLATCQENLDNIIPFMRENPDTEFIIFLPPYSMLYWEQKVLAGDLENMLQVYQYAMEQFLKYPNVQVYYFQNEKEIITDLDNYRDSAHHKPEYNRYIFECVKNGERRVTEENLEEQIQDMYEFARDFDYNTYWN